MFFNPPLMAHAERGRTETEVKNFARLVVVALVLSSVLLPIVVSAQTGGGGGMTSKLSVVLDESTPIAGEVVGGMTGVTVTKLWICASGEPIGMEKLGLEIDGSNYQSVSRITVWDGAVEVGEMIPSTDNGTVGLHDLYLQQDTCKVLSLRVDVAQSAQAGDMFSVNYQGSGQNPTVGVGAISGYPVYSSTIENTKASTFTVVGSEDSSVSGWVYKIGTEEPLPWATVWVCGSIKCYGAYQTDEQGFFATEDIPAGSVTVFASLWGYYSEQENLTLPAEVPLVIHMSVAPVSIGVESSVTNLPKSGGAFVQKLRLQNNTNKTILLYRWSTISGQGAEPADHSTWFQVQGGFIYETLGPYQIKNVRVTLNVPSYAANGYFNINWNVSPRGTGWFWRTMATNGSGFSKGQ